MEGTMFIGLAMLLPVPFFGLLIALALIHAL
jgi:hypothetical protein